MAKPLPEALRAPVTDLASGKAWLKALVEANLTFHLEDDPGEIVYIQTGEPIFDPADVPIIRERVASLYALEWGPRPGLGKWYCPIGYMASVEPFEAELQAKGFEVGAQHWDAAGSLTIIDRAHCPTYAYGEAGRFHLYRQRDGHTFLGAFDAPEEADGAMDAAFHKETT